MYNIQALDDIPVNQVIPVNKSNKNIRDDIFNLQESMLDVVASGVKEIDPEVNHFFAPGMYGREMTILAGTAIVGKIHKHSHINIISKGTIDVVTEFGKARYVGPVTFVSDPGTKRCVYAITDTIWTTIHATDETDLDKIEKEVIAEDYDELKLIEDGDK